jgi:sugar phosphate permease
LERIEPESGPARSLYALLTGDDEARVCKDIPDEACNEQATSFLTHLSALSLTKLGDGLADPKLVLAWLLSSLGAPGYLVGLLVPVRESLSLLPQLLVAARIRAHSVRKWFWVAGTIVEGTALFAMALAVLFLDGAVAGWTVIASLAVFSLARGVASIAQKDVLGKTVSKTRRGTVTGYATTLGSIGTGVFGIYLVGFGGSTSTVFFGTILCIAGALFIAAAAIFSRMAEAPGATQGGGNAVAFVKDEITQLGKDKDLARFVAARALFVATALMPPYLVMLLQRGVDASLLDLGLLVLAGGIAGGLSAAVWGRLADRSSRQVMMTAGGLAAVTASIVGIVALAAPGRLATPVLVPVAIFLVALAHAGMRIGRKTYIVDLAGSDRRAGYVALSNTLIGIVLLSSSLVGLVAEWAGASSALLLLAGLAALGVLLANGLPEVQSAT